jgi:hypothetical protein
MKRSAGFIDEEDEGPEPPAAVRPVCERAGQGDFREVNSRKSDLIRR